MLCLHQIPGAFQTYNHKKNGAAEATPLLVWYYAVTVLFVEQQFIM